MSTRTEKLGRSIYDYFIQRTSPNESFNLCIDFYTYEHCANHAGLSESDIKCLLSGEGMYSVNNSWTALAIVALEIKIAYDIETDKDLQTSYNRRVIKNFHYMNNEVEVQQFYRAYQDDIWKRTKELFAKEKRYLDIPKPKRGSGRYVQYPISQRIIDGISIIKYADIFIDIGLEPCQLLTYEYFKGLVFNQNEFFRNEMIRRMIFSFYCVWDGRSFYEIRNRKRTVTQEEREKKARDEFFIQLEPSIRFFINNNEIDLMQDAVPEKYFWRFDNNPFLTSKGFIFLKDNDYQDWLIQQPQNKKIDPEEELLLLTKQENYPDYIESLRNSGEIEVIPVADKKYYLLLLNLKEKGSFSKLNIEYTSEPYLSLVGGLKSKRNTYYSFALPSVKLLENLYDKTQYKSILLDSKEYPVENGMVRLSGLVPGKHCLKLFNSWDSSEMYFYVAETSERHLPEVHGWEINFESNKTEPCRVKENTIIDGLKIIGELKWIERKQNDKISFNNSLRPFLQMQERLERRFVKEDSKIAKRRRQYGD